jgi:hypothetical protein
MRYQIKHNVMYIAKATYYIIDFKFTLSLRMIISLQNTNNILFCLILENVVRLCNFIFIFSFWVSFNFILRWKKNVSILYFFCIWKWWRELLVDLFYLLSLITFDLHANMFNSVYLLYMHSVWFSQNCSGYSKPQLPQNMSYFF